MRRPTLAEQLREARDDGDPDNPVLFDLVEELEQLERRINLLEAQVAAARVALPAGDGAAGIGSCVRVRYCDSDEVAEYHLVGPIEPHVGNNRVSIFSDLGFPITTLTGTPRCRSGAPSTWRPTRTC